MTKVKAFLICFFTPIILVAILFAVNINEIDIKNFIFGFLINSVFYGSFIVPAVYIGVKNREYIKSVLLGALASISFFIIMVYLLRDVGQI